jgi:hypothetical protein
MEFLTWPRRLELTPREFWMGPQANVQIRTSPTNGVISTSVLPGVRWLIRMVLRNNTDASDLQPEVEAFLAGLEGQTNRAVIPHLHRMVPRGSLRGTPVSGGAVRGARSMDVIGASGATLRNGDMLGVMTAVGQRLIMVRSATGTGTISITFSPALPAAVAPGSAVQWDAPGVVCILTDPVAMVGYVKGGHPGVVLEFAETLETA